MHEGENYFIDDILLDSRLTPNGNGTSEDKDFSTKPTGGQKWWIAVILGMIFGLLSSPTAASITSYVSSVQEKSTSNLLLRMVLFIIILRIIMW